MKKTIPNPSSKFSTAPALLLLQFNFLKLVGCLFSIVSITYLFYSLRFFVFSPPSCFLSSLSQPDRVDVALAPPANDKTGLQHLVFAIAASSKLWDRRKEYIKLWWKPDHMNGVVWLDQHVKNDTDRHLLPHLMISANTSSFRYSNPRGHRSAIRISRIVSETLRLMRSKGQEESIRWLVMGDDDTLFVPDNLVRVLSKYDHNQMYYVGSSSESHLQNIYFSYNMAYGGGGFAISRPLAAALERMQDRCIKRYPTLYGSDDRIQACMAELGVPLTREPGFHQYDVYGNLFGLLAAHPLTPLLSLHHIDVVDPIFPNLGRLQSLQRLMASSKLDSAAILQQSICYDRTRSWTVSVSWGYAVQILRGIYLPRDLEIPSRTFLNWYKRTDQVGFSFNTRPLANIPCQKPSLYFLSNVLFNSANNETSGDYVRHSSSSSECKWKMADPSRIHRVQVHKKPNPNLWDKAPRRHCCRVLPTKKNAMAIHVGECREDEVVEL